MLPAETDLNTLPLLSNLPEKVFPSAAKSSECDCSSPFSYSICFNCLQENLLSKFYGLNNCILLCFNAAL